MHAEEIAVPLLSLSVGFWGIQGGQRLTMLCLSNNNLTGELPASLSRVHTLERLDLSRNALVGHIPDFSNMNGLRVLDLSHNGFHGVASVGCPSALQDLSLSCNRLSSLPAESLPTSLVHIHLNANAIHTPLPSALGRLKNLQFLNLSNNGFHGAIPTSYGNLTRLKVFFASNNQLSGEIPTALTSLPDLQEVYVNGNAGLIVPKKKRSRVHSHRMLLVQKTRARLAEGDKK